MKNLWINLSVASALLLAVFACSSEGSRDEQFCSCMKVSDELNQFSASLFERAATAEDEKKMKSLRDKTQKECKHYQRMPGDEMRKRKKMCK